MKIAHVIDSDGVYGAEIMLLNLMEAHKSEGHHPVLISINQEEEGEQNQLIREANKKNIETINLVLKKGYSYKSAEKIFRIIESKSVDITHTHGYKGNILLGSIPKAKRPTPVISTIHGWTSIRKFSKIWFYNLIDRMFLKNLDALVFVNKENQSSIRHKRKYVVENCISKLSFNLEIVSATDPDLVEQCKNAFVVGSISRLSEEKGIIYLLKALKKLINDDNNYKAIIIGEGLLEDHLREYIKTNKLTDKVILTGYKKNAYRFLQLFDVFVLPSLTEGLPMVILEAMQASVPIVATEVGGIPSILRNKIEGIVIKPSNSDELADAISLIKNNPKMAKEMTYRSLEKVQNKYSVEKMAKEYIKIYKMVLSEWN